MPALNVDSWYEAEPAANWCDPLTPDLRRVGNLSVGVDGRTVRPPMTFGKRDGRKLVITPDGSTWAPPRRRVDNAVVKAIVRAFRWRNLLERGTYENHQRNRRGGKDQRFIYRPRVAADAARAGDRRGDSGWAAAGGDDAGGFGTAVSVTRRVQRAAILGRSS
jgi:hypothetical protein